MATHGKASTYRNTGCRCKPCTDANTERARRGRAERVERAKTNPEIVPHGAGGYRNWGCRCQVCTDANTARCVDYAKRRAQKGES